MFFDEMFDVIVVGAGHAGCEAASAAARLGVETALVTMNLDLIGQMSCNPAIGGIAKGHLVREIDALGGIMGKIIDRTGIQFRLLNRSRGPAVQSPRAQADRGLYRNEMRKTLEFTPNLNLRQGTVIDLIVENRLIKGVILQDGRTLGAKAVVVATGTFLNGTIHSGKNTFSAGRSGEPASVELAQVLKNQGFPVGRLKTGTPPRLDGRTIDWDAFELQEPDERPVPFSFSTDKISQSQINCYIGYTSSKLHQIIRDNLHQSPLYSGKIKGVGPRYCPSIEDKVVKFADKDRHQLFLEPEGHFTNEVYLNGFSTSLPPQLQAELLKTIRGFENVNIIRPGYAIEYDFVDPRELSPTMETSRIKGLFFAGQINGTTGYEEAACQGLVAGINSSLQVLGRAPLILSRNDSYIGVLTDDLIRHGVDEPYRIFTSRAEYRLKLRYDNADQRLSPIGREIGLYDNQDWEKFNSRQDNLGQLRQVFDNTKFKRSDSEYNMISQSLGISLGDSFSISQLTQRQGINADFILKVVKSLTGISVSLSSVETVMADILYEGYIPRQNSVSNRINHYDGLKIPRDFNFNLLEGLSNEMVERLNRAQPATFAQIRNIPGITPAAVSTVLVYLNARSHKN